MPNPVNNTSFRLMCNTLNSVMSSAAEAKTGGIYMGIQCACPMQIAEINIDHPQPFRDTTFYSDKSTVKGIITASLSNKLSKFFDMHFYCMPDKIIWGNFNLVWKRGFLSMTDYFTNHHKPWHHKKMWYKCLHHS